MQNFLPPKTWEQKTILLRPDGVECSLPGSYDISLEADFKSAGTPSGLAYLPNA